MRRCRVWVRTFGKPLAWGPLVGFECMPVARSHFLSRTPHFTCQAAHASTMNQGRTTRHHLCTLFAINMLSAINAYVNNEIAKGGKCYAHTTIHSSFVCLRSGSSTPLTILSPRCSLHALDHTAPFPHAIHAPLTALSTASYPARSPKCATQCPASGCWASVPDTDRWRQSQAWNLVFPYW